MIENDKFLIAVFAFFVLLAFLIGVALFSIFDLDSLLARINNSSLVVDVSPEDLAVERFVAFKETPNLGNIDFPSVKIDTAGGNVLRAETSSTSRVTSFGAANTCAYVGSAGPGGVADCLYREGEIVYPIDFIK